MKWISVSYWVLSSLHANSTNSFYQRKTTPTGSLGNDVWETSAEIPYWWRITTLIWIVLLIGCTFALTNQKHYPQLGSEASSVGNSAVFSQVSFRGETVGWVAKCRLFSHATFVADLQASKIVLKSWHGIFRLLTIFFVVCCLGALQQYHLSVSLRS